MLAEKYMRMALALIKSTVGQTSPNPAVGAVIVKKNQIVGMGAHLHAGDKHAEIQALEMAKDSAKGATMYVTLEPCNHYGRTGPCTLALIESGITSVIIGTLDPNPRVSGKGVQALEAAGLHVEVGLLTEEIKEVNKIYNYFIQTGRPYVTLKAAMSLDGKIATKTGESQWITGSEARLDVHQYRHQYDAILVGVGTILKDNPHLTTRLVEGGKHPIRIILDHHLRTPASANVIIDEEAETWIFTVEKDRTKQAILKKSHVHIIEMNDRLKLEEVSTYLGQNSITSVWVEGGGTVNASFLQTSLVNELIIYLAPKLIGGKTAPTFYEGLGIEHIGNATDFHFDKVEIYGEDVKLIAHPK